MSREAARPISQPTAGTGGLRGQPAGNGETCCSWRRRGDTDAGGYSGGEAAGVEPPAPVITSGDPLLPTRYNPELLRARWSRTCPRCVQLI